MRTVAAVFFHLTALLCAINLLATTFDDDYAKRTYWLLALVINLVLAEYWTERARERRP